MDRTYVPLCTFKEDHYVPVSKMNKAVIKRVVYDILRVSSYHVLHLKRNVMSTKKKKKERTVISTSLVSQCDLAVRRLAGKQKDLGSIRFGSPFSSLQKLWFMDTVL